jgi:predicted small metal-binding protein
MAKMLRCRDIGVDCDFEVCGSDETDVLTKGAEHARTAHNKTEFSPEEMAMVRAAMVEVDHCPHVPEHLI